MVLARKSRVDPDEASGKGKALVADEDVGKVFDSGGLFLRNFSPLLIFLCLSELETYVFVLLSEFLKLVRSLGDEDLAKLGAALGQKVISFYCFFRLHRMFLVEHLHEFLLFLQVAIAGAVAKERAESRSSQSKKLSELEARVSYLEKENDVLERLKNELRRSTPG